MQILTHEILSGLISIKYEYWNHSFQSKLSKYNFGQYISSALTLKSLKKKKYSRNDNIESTKD